MHETPDITPGMQPDMPPEARQAAEPETTGHADELRAALRRVASRAYALAAVRAGALLVIVALLGVLCAIGLDYLIRFPAWIRLAMLAGGVASLAWFALRVVRPLRTGAPGEIETALRLERPVHGPPAASATRLRLAAAADLARSNPGQDAFGASLSDPLAAALRAHALARALAQAPAPTGAGLVRIAPAGLPLLALALVAGAIVLGAWRAPGLARTGALRTLAPWADASWPTRYVIDDRTQREVHAIDRPLDFEVGLARTPSASPVVRVRYRVQQAGAGGQTTEWTTVRLVPQPGEGEPVYEHRLSPAELAALAPGGAASLQYVVLAGDADERQTTIDLVTPPAVHRVLVESDPPAYASALAATDALDLEVPPPDLTPDQIIDAGRHLAGSRVTLTLEHASVPTNRTPGWLDAWQRAIEDERAALSLDTPSASDIALAPGDTRSTLSFTLDRDVAIPVRLTDEHGLSPRGTTTLRLSARADEPPSASVLVPDRDERVLPTATVELLAEALDDLRLAEAAIEVSVAQAGSPASALDGAAWTTLEIARDPRTESVVLEHALALEPYGLEPGDIVLVRVRAQDTFELDGAQHPVVRSAVRRLPIISTEELVGDLRAELSGVRRTARLLDEDQAAAARDASRIDPASPNAEEELARIERLQDSITSRLEGLASTVARLDARRSANALADDAIEGLLTDASDVAQEAIDASERATRDSPPGDAEEARELVRDRLGELISMLDRGEDGWLARRSVERLADEQRRLMRETQDLERALRGRSLDELTPDERTDLQRIADRQREAAESLDSTLDELDERAGALSEADPGQAAALAEAAEGVRRAAAGQQMRDAADSIGQNQTGRAGEQQQAALDALQGALDEIDTAGQRRDEALRRRVASLMESIRALVRTQEGEIDALAANPADDQLDERMIRLHQNTLAVQGEASGGFRELTPAAGLLQAASEAQTDAIGALRAAPREAPRADAAERISLIRLREALEAASEVEENAAQREADRQREELRDAYRAALELQLALRTEAGPFAGERLTRRDRSTVRGIGARQRTLGESLATLLDEAEALADARVFRLAHARLAVLTEGAADALTAGTVDAGVLRRQDGAVGVLRALVTALSDDAQEEPEFQQQGNQGSTGSSGGEQGQEAPAVPPLAELMLLRSMQEHAAELTRALGESPDTPDPTEVAHLADLQRSLATEAQTLLEQLAGEQNTPPPENTPENPPAPDPQNERPGTPDRDGPREPSAPASEEPIEGAGS